MMEKLQRFGGAMFTPVLLFAFNGIVLAFAIAMQNELIVGNIAADGKGGLVPQSLLVLLFSRALV